MPATNRPPKLVSIATLAESLDVHPRTIRRRIADGTITGYRVGRLVKVDPAAVDMLMHPIPAAQSGGGR